MNKIATSRIAEGIRALDYLDYDLALFDRQYQLPQGISYNTYVVDGAKGEAVVVDGVDIRGAEEWLAAVDRELDGRKVPYFIIQHLEPDHSGSIEAFLKRHEEAVVVCTAKAAAMFAQFVPDIPAERVKAVKEGETLEVGDHTLQFIAAPMVHWPEVMMTYDRATGVLFSADAFGIFGADVPDAVLGGVPLEPQMWLDEARRYYCNIVGKYGVPVQSVLKKVLPLDIKLLAPLHGPVIGPDMIPFAVEKYQTWSSYAPETQGTVIFTASLHGSTLEAMEEWAQQLRRDGMNVEVLDLTTVCLSVAVAKAFEYSQAVMACASFDGFITPCMADLLYRLQTKGWQKRTVGIVENGSWAPCAARLIRATLTEKLRAIIILEPSPLIKTRLDDTSRAQLAELAKALQ